MTSPLAILRLYLEAEGISEHYSWQIHIPPPSQTTDLGEVPLTLEWGVGTNSAEKVVKTLTLYTQDR